MLIRIKFKQVVLILFRKRWHLCQNDYLFSYGRVDIVSSVDDFFVEDYVGRLDDFFLLGHPDDVYLRGYVPGHIPDYRLLVT